METQVRVVAITQWRILTSVDVRPLKASSLLVRGTALRDRNRSTSAHLATVRTAAEQLPSLDRWATLLAYICRKIVGQISLPTPPPALAGGG